MEIFTTCYTALINNMDLLLWFDLSSLLLFLACGLYVLYCLYQFLFSPIDIKAVNEQLKMARSCRELYPGLSANRDFDQKLLIKTLQLSYNRLLATYNRICLLKHADQNLLVQIYEELTLLGWQLDAAKGKQAYLSINL